MAEYSALALANETLERKTKLYNHFGSPRGWVNVIGMMGFSEFHDPEYIIRTYKWRAEMIASAYRRMLNEAIAGYIEPDLCRLIGRSLDQFPDMTLTEDLLPSPSGFVSFGHPFEMWVTVNGKDIDYPIVALSWERADASHPGIGGRGDDAVIITIYVDALEFERNLGHGTSALPPDSHVIGGSTVVWAFGTPVGSGYGVPYKEADKMAFRDMYETACHLQLLLSAILTYINAPRIVQERRARPERAFRRRAVKKGLGDVDKDVVVYRIRPIRDEDERQRPGRTKPVEWSCQWIVRSHYRHIRDEHGNVIKVIPIDSYIKGPPDKPLKSKKEKKHVFAVGVEK